MKPNRIAELRERARILIEYQPTCYVPVTGKELNECLDEIEKLQKGIEPFIALFDKLRKE